MRLIDGDALINTLQELFDKREKEARFTGDRGVTVTWNDAIYHIKITPTIEERKTGKWIEIEPPDIYVCPFCKHASSRKNFCGECGADLRGESNETD